MGYLAMPLFLCFSLWGGPRWATCTASWYDSVAEYNVVCCLVTQQLLEFQHISGILSKILTSSTSSTWTFSNHTNGQGQMLTQIGGCDLPLWECACASCACRGLYKESGCASVPHGTRAVYHGRFVCFTLHVMPRGCEWNSRLSL